jgi:hypothetical protein
MLVLRKDWINLVQSQLNSLDSSEILVFKTLKEDRSVYINKIGNYYKVIEDGFNNMTYDNLSLSNYFFILKLQRDLLLNYLPAQFPFSLS